MNLYAFMEASRLAKTTDNRACDAVQQEQI